MKQDYVSWLRERVGRRKVFMPFVTVILRDREDRVLLQRRSDLGNWGFPGGILELDEDIETAARRELLEETGLISGPFRLVGIYSDPRYDVTYPNGDQVQQFTVCLEGRRQGGEMRADGSETTEQRFVLPDQVAGYALPIWYGDMFGEAEMHVTPQFRAPFGESTTDQIAAVRPFVGSERISGIGASVVLRRDDGRLLMLQHVNEQYWRIPSGFADLGENVAHTAVREVREELGLEIEPQRLLGAHATPQLNTTYRNGDQVRVVGAVFEAHYHGGDLQRDPDEINDAAWMTMEEALAQVHPSRRTHYRHIGCCLAGGSFVE